MYFIFRLGLNYGGGAWCPRSAVDQDQKEWIEVDLSSLGKLPFLITEVGTQGRYANSHGREYTPSYTLQYWRPELKNFTTYTDTPDGEKVGYTVYCLVTHAKLKLEIVLVSSFSE